MWNISLVRHFYEAKGPQDMAIQIELVDIQNALVVAVTGQVNSVTAIQLGEKLQQAAKQGKFNIVLDFANVTYISSAGLREVINGLERAKTGGGHLCLANPSDPVMEVLDMTGLNRMLDIYPTREKAVQSFE
jgi:anti-anti-sigma factor